MLFSRGDKNEGQTKKQSTLGFLFNPQIGESIRPLGMVYAMFAQIIAMVFVTADLFPKDHPALRDPNIRLTMREVVGTAYANLKWTREGIPQICLFGAVIAMFVFTAMFVLTLISSLFVTNAHAQSMFQSSGEYDWGNNWLSYLFLGKSIPAPDGLIAPAASSCTMQQALGSALGFYSKGILVLAGFMLMYFLFRMIADTALTGKFMGQANQVWGPIRLVVAIGLLVPISSTNTGGCTISGLNTAQYIVVQMAKVGSNLASSTWKNFENALGSTTDVRSCRESDGTCTMVPPAVRELASALQMSYMCVAVTQRVLDEADLKDTYEMKAPTTDTVSGDYPFSLTYTDAFKAQLESYSNEQIAISQYCGGFKLKPVVPHEYQSVYNVYNSTTQSFLKDFENYANANAKKLMEKKPIDDPDELIVKFYNKVNTAVMNDVNNIDKNGSRSLNNELYTDMGWVAAGAWFNTIARIQANRTTAIISGVPEPIAPAVMSKLGTKGELLGVHTKVAETLLQFSNKLAEYAFKHENGGAKPVDLTGNMKTAATKGVESLIRSATGGSNPVEWFFSVLDYIGSHYGLWKEGTGELALKFGSTTNPLAEIAAFGQNNLAVAGYLATVSAGAKVLAAAIKGGNESITGKVLGFASLGAANSIASGTAATFDMVGALASLAAILFFNIGFVISFVLPMIPFFRFFFSSVSWLMSVFEAFVAAPLFALAHLNPYGDGLPGNARGGYFFILHIVLWPVLMIFGLIAGFLIFGVAVTFLNSMFIIAAQGTGNFSGALPSLSKLVYTVMYCVFLYSLANQSFKTIGFFFQHAMSWLGGGGHQEKIGDPNALAIGGVAAYLSKEIMPKVTAAPASLVSGANQVKKESKELVKKKSDENLEAAKLSAEGWVGTPNDRGVKEWAQIPPTTSDAGAEDAGAGSAAGGGVTTPVGGGDNSVPDNTGTTQRNKQEDATTNPPGQQPDHSTGNNSIAGLDPVHEANVNANTAKDQSAKALEVAQGAADTANKKNNPPKNNA